MVVFQILFVNDVYEIDNLPYFSGARIQGEMDKDVDKPDSTWRTSTQYFLPSSSHENISAIDYRVAALTNSKIQQQEWVQVLRYEKTQQYKHHTDYFGIATSFHYSNIPPLIFVITHSILFFLLSLALH